MAPRLPNCQGKGGGVGTWAERWDKGEGAMGWGGARAWAMGGILMSKYSNSMKCEWPQHYKMTQTKSLIKNSELFYICAALLL